MNAAQIGRGAALVALGLALGGAAVIFGESRVAASDEPSEPLRRCITAADPMSTDFDSDSRALKIANCMAGNGYVFRGAVPSSHCFAQDPRQLRVKHILPSCYQRTTILLRLQTHD